MTRGLFSIAIREMRVAARQRRAYRLRLFGAAAATVVLAWLFWLQLIGGWMRPRDMFEALAWCAGLFALLAGLIANVDSIVGEKRDGTLGLLFLTKLSSVEILLGKLTGNSLMSLLALMGMAPVLAVPMLLGGVPLPEFGRVVLSLICFLGFSSSVALFVSVHSKRSSMAAGSCAVLLFLFWIGPLLLEDSFRRDWQLPWASEAVQFVSIYHLLDRATSTPPADFWWTLAAISSLALLFLGAAGWALPRVWQDRPDRQKRRGMRALWRWLSAGPPAWRERFRSKALERNPIYWITAPGGVNALGFSMAAILSAFACLGIAHGWSRPSRPLEFFEVFVGSWAWFSAGLDVVVLAMSAFAATRRFSDDKRSGAFEFLLSAPLGTRSILWGHYRGYLRRMLLPWTCVAAAHVLLAWLVLSLILLEWPQYAVTAEGILWQAVWSPSIAWPAFDEDWQIWLVVSGLAGLALLLSLLSLGWVGMWCALRFRQARTAPWGALALVLVPPGVAFIFAVTTLVMVGVNSPGLLTKWIAGIALALLAIHHSALLFWALSNLRRRFRHLALNAYEEVPPGLAWRRLKGFAATALVVSSAVALFYSVEQWRGSRAWLDAQKNYGSLLKAGALGSEGSERNATGFPSHRGTAMEQSRGDQLRALNIDSLRTTNTWMPRQSTRPAVHKFIDLRENAVYLRPDLVKIPSGLNPEHQARMSARQAVTNDMTVARAAELILERTAPATPLLDALSQAGRVEMLRVLRLEDIAAGQAMRDSQPLQVLGGIIGVLELKAASSLAVGDSESAFRDVLLILALAELLSTSDDRTVVHAAQNLSHSAFQAIWEGLVQERWSDLQLAELERVLGQIDCLSRWPRLVKGFAQEEMRFWDEFPDQVERRQWRGSLRTIYPAGWVDFGRARGLAWASQLAGLVDVSDSRFDRARAQQLFHSPPSISQLRSSYWTAVAYLFSAIERGQFIRDAAFISCRIERHWRQEGSLPDSLSDMADTSVRPRDWTTGQDYAYRIIEPEGYLLHPSGPETQPLKWQVVRAVRE